VVGVIRFALFDLDNTLADQETALERWARDFVDARGLDPASVDWFLVKRATMPSWDEFIRQIKIHFNLSDEPEQLLRASVEAYVRYFVLDTAVADGLRQLREQGWKLGIVTNGSTAVQDAKIDRMDLRSSVDAVVVSEEAGVRKPERAIFEIAAQRLGVELGPHGWMVGDTLDADIAGGAAAGLRTIWLPAGRPLPTRGPRPDLLSNSMTEALKLLATTD
jgi:HAD superfamily hydrolase (TIGR01549 family)